MKAKRRVGLTDSHDSVESGRGKQANDSSSEIAELFGNSSSELECKLLPIFVVIIPTQVPFLTELRMGSTHQSKVKTSM